MTSTFAPTKRKGLPSITKRTPLARTNPRRAEAVPLRQLENANTIAATASKADAATNNRLIIKFGTLASWRAALYRGRTPPGVLRAGGARTLLRIRKPHESQNRADGPEHYKGIKKRADHQH